ncbi:hypothetical protein AALO_G00043820 [Alosa alosa]|uniref:Uncharacterized protein n=1 Tax=Alosa alosa TaxID=278164 RepID=A0AAV6H894_9TELE|nr:hypothetical protein AALO_G00043820 [Alosa alosa]
MVHQHKTKGHAQSRGLTQTGELQDLVQNAVATEIEEGWDSDMSSILLLVHLLPPSSQGRKRPEKISAMEVGVEVAEKFEVPVRTKVLKV